MDKVCLTFVTPSQKINSLILVACHRQDCCVTILNVVLLCVVFYLFHLNNFKILFLSQRKMLSKFLSASQKINSQILVVCQRQVCCVTMLNVILLCVVLLNGVSSQNSYDWTTILFSIFSI